MHKAQFKTQTKRDAWLEQQVQEANEVLGQMEEAVVELGQAETALSRELEQIKASEVEKKENLHELNARSVYRDKTQRRDCVKVDQNIW